MSSTSPPGFLAHRRQTLKEKAVDAKQALNYPAARKETLEAANEQTEREKAAQTGAQTNHKRVVCRQLSDNARLGNFGSQIVGGDVLWPITFSSLTQSFSVKILHDCIHLRHKQLNSNVEQSALSEQNSFS